MHPAPDLLDRLRKAAPLGGKARAKKLTAKQRRDIARKAAVARWSALTPEQRSEEWHRIRGRTKKAEAAA